MSSADRVSAPDLAIWQRNLLPFLVRFVVGLTIFFLLASFAQLFYLHRQIMDAAPFALSPEARRIDLTGTETPDQRFAISRFRTAAELELQLVARRYRQATVLLLGRVWALYLGFVTGMILCLVGAAFVLAKLREPETELSAQAAGAAYAIRTASPGIMMAALGVVLMLTSILTNHRIDVKDSATYLNADRPEAPRQVQEQNGPPLIAPSSPQQK